MSSMIRDHTGHKLATYTMSNKLGGEYPLLCTGCLTCQSPVIMAPRRIFPDGTMETQDEADARHAKEKHGLLES